MSLECPSEGWCEVELQGEVWWDDLKQSEHLEDLGINGKNY
jgi:hypothetical protein